MIDESRGSSNPSSAKVVSMADAPPPRLVRKGRLLMILLACSMFDAGPTLAAPPVAPERSAATLFEKRILPILASPKPSSCAECHLGGVDLKNYVRPEQRDTFAALVAGGLIDLKQPDESKLLKFIERKPKAPNLVTDAIRKEEAEAFRDWIRAAVADPALTSVSGDAKPAGPTIPLEIVRHARKDRVLQSFLENVWNEAGRCAACHSPDRNAEQVRKHGPKVSWMVLNDPMATFDRLVERDLIDAEDATESQLLLKPLNKTPHGGGQKMVVGDRTYKQFRRFLDDYSAIRGARYRAATELPTSPGQVASTTDIWLKLTEVPAKFDKQLLQVDLHHREGGGWSKDRWATSDRPVFGGGRLWQHSLSLTAPRDSTRAARLTEGRLPAGRYLVRIFVDRTGKLERDFRTELGPEDLVAEIEVESAWPAGYGRMTTAKYVGK